MRLLIVAILLGGAVPAGASPITIEFRGTITALSYFTTVPQPWPTAYVPPPAPQVGNEFLLSVMFDPSYGHPTSMSLSAYQGWTSCACSGAVLGSPTTLHFNPSTVYGPNGFSLYQSLLAVTLNQGWQSGSFGLWLETAASIETYIVSGTITGSRRVPEPATILMVALGVSAFAGLRRQRSPVA